MGSRDSCGGGGGGGVFHFKIWSKDKPLSWRPLLPYSCEILFDLLILRVGSWGPEMQSHCSRAQAGLQPGLNIGPLLLEWTLEGMGQAHGHLRWATRAACSLFWIGVPVPPSHPGTPVPFSRAFGGFPSRAWQVGSWCSHRVGSWCSHFGTRSSSQAWASLSGGPPRGLQSINGNLGPDRMTPGETRWAPHTHLHLTWVVSADTVCGVH